MMLVLLIEIIKNLFLYLKIFFKKIPSDYKWHECIFNINEEVNKIIFINIKNESTKIKN